MPTVAELPPPKPIVPPVPARLLASASAPTLAVVAGTDPGYRDCLAALSVMAANPEEDPAYRETWDSYWARVRPQRSRPYEKACRTPSPPKREKGNLFPILFVLFPIGRGRRGGIYVPKFISQRSKGYSRLAVLVPKGKKGGGEIYVSKFILSQMLY